MSSRTTSVSRRRAARAAALVVGAALLAGCVRMPTSGPVEVPEVTTDVDDAPGISFDPRPPQDGDPVADIVEGFLEAMKAAPVGVSVARQFLSREAAETWAPERQVITYAEIGDATTGTSMRLPMTDVNRYDARGAWQRTQGGAQLSIGLVEEDGEWRIDEVPDALVVPATWFDDWYDRASLYYFDPASEVLVPEPVFVPRGEQFASSLVRGLVAQLPPESADVVRTYFPAGTSQGLSVPIVSGIASVDLSGDPDAVDGETADRMLAQLVWTLRQDLDIKAVQLSIGGRPFSFQGGSTQVNLGGVGADYDPNGVPANTSLFALDEGLVVSGGMGGLEPTSGPFGQEDRGLRSIGVSISGDRVAGVSATGSDLLTAPTEAPTGEVTTISIGALDLAPPSWDHRDRIWLLDRANGRARVILVVDGTPVEEVVPGLSGRRVTQLLVSRDGTRLVAVLRGRSADRVISTRIRHDSAGAIVGFTPAAHPVHAARGQGPRPRRQLALLDHGLGAQRHHRRVAGPHDVRRRRPGGDRDRRPHPAARRQPGDRLGAHRQRGVRPRRT